MLHGFDTLENHNPAPSVSRPNMASKVDPKEAAPPVAAVPEAAEKQPLSRKPMQRTSSAMGLPGQLLVNTGDTSSVRLKQVLNWHIASCRWIGRHCFSSFRCTRIYICICVYIYIYIYFQIFTHTHIYIYIYIYLYIYAQTHT